MRAAGDKGLVVGVDTHLDTHTAGLCDGRGRLVAQGRVPAASAGYARLLGWARTAAKGAPAAWAVEGPRHYGLGLARHLASKGEYAGEIGASRHVSKRRAGKAMRSMRCGPPGNCPPARSPRRGAPTAAVKRCAC